MWFKKEKRVLSSISNRKLALYGNKFTNLFLKHGGPNYLSLTFYDDNNSDDNYEILIRKFTGKTPAEKNIELEKQIKDYSHVVKEVKNYLVAASEGSMSRNNSENLADELLFKINNITEN